MFRTSDDLKGQYNAGGGSFTLGPFNGVLDINTNSNHEYIGSALSLGFAAAINVAYFEGHYSGGYVGRGYGSKYGIQDNLKTNIYDRVQTTIKNKLRKYREKN